MPARAGWAGVGVALELLTFTAWQHRAKTIRRRGNRWIFAATLALAQSMPKRMGK